MSRCICVHGHFYQPPRENPWLETVEVQDSAAPFHDWNRRISAECYAPNRAARILGGAGKITAIVNNYETISFNFGPTLLSWLEIHDPATHQALIQADKRSAERWGRGNALAQVYNHLIMPLATERDKLTQVRWGISDFELRFGRRPRGMWLAEAAVDIPSLECLAQEGIEFTILSPGQAARIRPPGGGGWQKLDGGKLDSRRPYFVSLPSGREITVFFYDGAGSRDIAFAGLLKDGTRLASRLKGLLDSSDGEAQLASVATDGESYGHHHRFGEMALAFALERLDQDPEVELTNYASFLDRYPATWQVEIVENSSWSCAHGVERWRSDCGCAIDPGRGWSQAWRQPLRLGLDETQAELVRLFAEQGGDLFRDPWAARDAYGQVLCRPGFDSRAWEGFLVREQSRPLNPREEVRAAKLLECQRWALFAFTSCAWFFDDLAGVETVQNLRFMARALQLAGELEERDWQTPLLDHLAMARSNQPGKGSGARIWKEVVAPARVGPKRVAAHAAISGVIGEEPPPPELYCYVLQTKSHRHRHNLGLHVSWGRMTLFHRRIGDEFDLAFAAFYDGGHGFSGWVGPAEEASGLDAIGAEVEGPMRMLDLGALETVLAQAVGGRGFSIIDLFLEGRRKLARTVLAQTMDEHRATVRSMFESSREAMLFLRANHVPLPRIFIAAASAMLGEELVEGMGWQPERPLPARLGELVREARKLGLSFDAPWIRRGLERALGKDLRRLSGEPGAQGFVSHASGLLDLAAALEMEPDLWEAQNLYCQIGVSPSGRGLDPQWEALGEKLKLDINVRD